MRTALVGCTGFVGGNLASQYAFDAGYHAADIAQSFGTKPELLVYAGLPAAKYLANTDPEGVLAVCKNALENLRRIAPERLVLISTVDVYAAPCGVTEQTPPGTEQSGAYGRNRALLEQWVRERWPEALILRLPGLFGRGLKKNFLYDFLTLTPAMLRPEAYEREAAKSELVRGAYAPAQNGFYALTPRAKTQDAPALRAWFSQNSFNALSFTDSRSVYQFYDLSGLWKDAARALEAGLTLLNLATEPVSAAECYAALTHGGAFHNELRGEPAAYDMRSLYAELWGGKSGYLVPKEEVLAAMCEFAAAVRREQR